MTKMTALEYTQGVHDWVNSRISRATENFITKTVSDLVNYYTKSETYTKAEVRQIVDAIKQFTYEVVQTLPTASSETMNKIYLAPAPKIEDKNLKEEYITIFSDGAYSWEMFGTTSIDLSNYYTKGQTDSVITAALNSALANYTTTNALTALLAAKQDVIQDLADIRSGAHAGSTAVQPSDLSSYFNNVSYDTNTHRINFYHGQNIVAFADASPFIVDGMINDVRIENGYLVIDFNTDSGKQDISIPLTDIFDPSNYYNKTQTDGLLSQKQDVIQDLADIRSGAHAGSTAVQPSTLSNVVKNMVAESCVYDVSANNDNTKFESLSALLGSANLNTLIPTDFRKGGMSIKFVRTSDQKYVQYRYMGTSTANADFTNAADWQGLDDAVIKDSKNPVTGGAIYNALMNIVVINATANKGNISEDAVITVKVEGETVATETGSVSLVIEYGKEFSVECSRIYDYITPEPQTFTAGPSIQKIFCNYTYVERDTITLDQTETDEESMITGDVQGDVIKDIRAASHLYLGTPLQDGSEFTCQLSDIDGTKYFDGTDAALDGSEGDQWMKLPVFWWKRTAIGTAAEDGSHDSYSFSFAIAGEPDPSWHKWEGAKNLLGAKEMTVINGVGHSISGGQSTGSLTKAQFETAAAARSAGSTCVTWEWQWMMCTLFYAWYGRTNSQKQCGTGSNSYTRTLGTKDALGMTDTTNSNGNSDNTKFWGIENWWGCKSEWIGRVTSNNYVLTILDMNTGQSRTVSGFIQCGGTGGWTSRMKITEDMDYIPVAKSGTDTTSYCDWVNSNSGSLVVFRSDHYANTYGGVACVLSSSAPSATSAHVGSRLAFNGVITEAESVAAYKAALPVGQ